MLKWPRKLVVESEDVEVELEEDPASAAVLGVEKAERIPNTTRMRRKGSAEAMPRRSERRLGLISSRLDQKDA